MKQLICVDCGYYIIAPNPTRETKYCRCESKAGVRVGTGFKPMEQDTEVKTFIQRLAQMDDDRSYMAPAFKVIPDTIKRPTLWERIKKFNLLKILAI